MSHAPHAYQPQAPMQPARPAAFNPRQAMQPVHQHGYAPAPQHPHAYAQPPYPAQPQAFQPYPPAAHPSARPQMTPVSGPPLSKKEAKRAAKARKAMEKQQKKAAKRSSPIVPFFLGLVVGAILTTYMSNALFASKPLEGPAWTLPSEGEVPLAEVVPDDEILFDEGGG